MVARHRYRLVLLLAVPLTVMSASTSPDAFFTRAAKHIEPAHQVVYLYTVPAAKPEDRFEMTYLDAEGRQRTLTRPGYPPAWVELVHLPPGGTRLELTVRSSAASTAPMIHCRIQVDDSVRASDDGNPCRARLTFPMDTKTREK